MHLRTLLVAASPLMLIACGGPDDTSTNMMADTTAPGTMAATDLTGGPTGVGAEGALGLTEEQLLDADLVDANGNDLGDVEGLVRGADGTIERLLVEIDDTDPDRYVHVPIAGLEAVRDGDDWDLRTTMTREDLMALDSVTR